MSRLITALLAGFAFLVVFWPSASVTAEEAAVAQWVWFNEGNPAQSVPGETRYFRRLFEINRPGAKVVDEAALEITADNSFTVWVNGVEVGKGDQWQQLYRFDVQKHLASGKNILAVEAANESPGPAALVVKLSYTPSGQAKAVLVSDGQWKAAKTAAEGWRKVDFDDKGWQPVKVIGPFGKTPPWNSAAAAGAPPKAGPERFTVPEGFKVETVQLAGQGRQGQLGADDAGQHDLRRERAAAGVAGGWADRPRH
jgi:alpha-L-rhamnosidase